jgi:hypothetical protein
MTEVFDSVDQVMGRTVDRTLMIINFCENIKLSHLFPAIAFALLTPHLEQSRPKTYERTIRDCGLNRNEEPVLKQAFDDYIGAMTRSKHTISKWKGTHDFLVSEFGEYKPLKEIDSIELMRLFKKFAAKDYALATPKKNLQRVKQLWSWHHGARKLLTNPAKKGSAPKLTAGSVSCGESAHADGGLC